MPTPITLESEERAFFGMVERAAFSNPFGDERGYIDRRIVEAPDSWSRPRLLEELVKRVEQEGYDWIRREFGAEVVVH